MAWNFFSVFPYWKTELAGANQIPRSTSKQTGSEEVMDAKYNWIIDNTGVRVALNIAGFAIWLLACAALLSF